MRIVVFGGTGMLGRAVRRAGRRRGHAVLAPGRSQADITDAERVLATVTAFRPDTVINCAAFTRVDDCESEAERAELINGSAVSNVVAGADAVGAHLLQVSTDYVFDGAASEPYREEDATGPRSVYGTTKLLGEQRALAYPRAGVVRTSWLFGPGGPNFVATMVRLMRRPGAALRVVADQVGCPTYAPYLAAALLDLAGLRWTGVVHYRNRGPVSWHGFAEEIARQLDAPVEIRAITTPELPRPAARPPYSVLSVAKIEKLFGRRVEDWKPGLADYLRRQPFEEDT